VIPDARRALATREEIEAELGRLDARERGLRAQQRDLIHRVEHIVLERERLERHLKALGVRRPEARSA
jgi:hypothetical protein